eukprot:8824909-Heterocapsa_arctica.AAC.1
MGQLMHMSSHTRFRRRISLSPCTYVLPAPAPNVLSSVAQCTHGVRVCMVRALGVGAYARAHLSRL